MAGADFTLGPEVFNRDETFEYTISWRWEEDDGTVSPFDWSAYSYEYWLEPPDGCGSRNLYLTEGDGITIDPVKGWATFSAETPRVGRHLAKCRLTHKGTGKTRILFEQPLIVGS
jgi:hypothetical protein